MTLFDLQKAIANIDDDLIQYVKNNPYKKHRKLKAFISIAASIVIIIASISVYNTLRIPQDNIESSQDFPTASLNKDNFFAESALLDDIKINKIPPIYSTSKFVGYMRKVSEKKWKKRYGTEKFLAAHNKTFYFTTFRKKICPQGFVQLKLSDGTIVQIRVFKKNIPIIKKYRNLKETMLGNTRVAICKDKKSSYGVLVYGKHSNYSFETNPECTIEDFILLLKEIFIF